MSDTQEVFLENLNNRIVNNMEEKKIKHQLKMGELYEEASHIDVDTINKGRDILNSLNL